MDFPFPVKTKPSAPEIIKFEDPAKNYFKPKDSRDKKATTEKENDLSTKEVIRSTSAQIEKLAASELKGNERRRYLLQKLNDLGMPKAHNTNNRFFGSYKHPINPRVPFKMALQMIDKCKARAEIEKINDLERGEIVADSKGNGVKRNYAGKEVVLTSLSHPLLPTFEKQANKEKIKKALGTDKRSWDERGMKSGVGKYKDGVLYLNKKVVAASDEDGNNKRKKFKRK